MRDNLAVGNAITYLYLSRGDQIRQFFWYIVLDCTTLCVSKHSSPSSSYNLLLIIIIQLFAMQSIYFRAKLIGGIEGPLHTWETIFHLPCLLYLTGHVLSFISQALTCCGMFVLVSKWTGQVDIIPYCIHLSLLS